MATSLLILCAAGAPCSAEAPKKILLVSVDTLRADHLSVYDKYAQISPAIEKWSKGAMVFERGSSQAPWTIPSFAAAFTGRYPSEVNVFFNRSSLSKSFTTLAETLKDQGYKTATFNGHPVLLSPVPGLLQGFDTVRPAEFKNQKIPFAGIEPELMAWLGETKGDKIFAWIHFMEVHNPATPKNPYAKFFRRYASEVRLVDDYFSRIMSKLEEIGAASETMVIFIADHGEGLNEHGAVGHQNNLFQEILRVPFVISMPGGAHGRSDEPASLVDLTPTILEAIGIPPSGQFSGRSLLPIVRGGKLSSGDEPQFAERFFCDGLHHLTVRRGRYKLYVRIPYEAARGKKIAPRLDNFDWDISGPESEKRLYDLEKDPRELNDIAAAEPGEVKALLATLESWKTKMLASVAKQGAPEPQMTLDPETEKALKSLGYLN